MKTIEIEEFVDEWGRVIVSVVIVAAIALGIYSYSNRTEDQHSRSAVPTQRDSSCEEFGDATTLNAVPLRCKTYWEEKTSIR